MSEKKSTGVSLTDDIIEIVQDFSRSKGLFNFSSAIRVIVLEWKELTGYKITEKGREALKEENPAD